MKVHGVYRIHTRNAEVRQTLARQSATSGEGGTIPPSTIHSHGGDVFQWLPDETPNRELYNDFVQQFGVDDFLVVTWPQCEITDPRCDTFADALIQNDTQDFFESAVSGRQLVRQLLTWQRQSPQRIIDRFQGIYFGPDGKSTCVIVMLTEHGMNHRESSVARVKQTASIVAWI